MFLIRWQIFQQHCYKPKRLTDIFGTKIMFWIT